MIFVKDEKKFNQTHNHFYSKFNLFFLNLNQNRKIIKLTKRKKNVNWNKLYRNNLNN